MLLIHADGGCQPNPGEGSIGVVVYENGQLHHTYRARIGPATNNIAEWRAAIQALEVAYNLKAHDEIELRMDSRMVVMQLKGLWKVRDYKLRPLAVTAAEWQEKIRTRGAKLTINWVPREDNAVADNAAALVR